MKMQYEHPFFHFHRKWTAAIRMHNITIDLIHVIIKLNAKWNLRHFRDDKIYIKRKMVQKRRRNDKQISVIIIYVKTTVLIKMDVHIAFSILVKNKNDGKYTDHLDLAQFVRCELCSQCKEFCCQASCMT